MSAAALKVNLGVYFAPAGVIQQKEQRRELRHMIKEPCKQRTCSIFMMCRVWPMVFPKENFVVIICSLSPKTVGTSLKHYLTNIFNSSVDRLVYDLTTPTSCRILISKWRTHPSAFRSYFSLSLGVIAQHQVTLMMAAGLIVKILMWQRAMNPQKAPIQSWGHISHTLSDTGGFSLQIL